MKGEGGLDEAGDDDLSGLAPSSPAAEDDDGQKAASLHLP